MENALTGNAYAKKDGKDLTVAFANALNHVFMMGHAIMENATVNQDLKEIIVKTRSV